MERTIPEMINSMTPGKNPVLVDISSTDYTVGAGVVVHGISAVSGTVILVDIKNEAGTTVSSVSIPVGMVGVMGITKVYKTGTDATGIVLWVD